MTGCRCADAGVPTRLSHPVKEPIPPLSLPPAPLLLLSFLASRGPALWAGNLEFITGKHLHCGARAQRDAALSFRALFGLGLRAVLGRSPCRPSPNPSLPQPHFMSFAAPQFYRCRACPRTALRPRRSRPALFYAPAAKRARTSPSLHHPPSSVFSSYQCNDTPVSFLSFQVRSHFSSHHASTTYPRPHQGPSPLLHDAAQAAAPPSASAPPLLLPLQSLSHSAGLHSPRFGTRRGAA